MMKGKKQKQQRKRPAPSSSPSSSDSDTMEQELPVGMGREDSASDVSFTDEEEEEMHPNGAVAAQPIKGEDGANAVVSFEKYLRLKETEQLFSSSLYSMAVSCAPLTPRTKRPRSLKLVPPSLSLSLCARQTVHRNAIRDSSGL